MLQPAIILSMDIHIQWRTIDGIYLKWATLIQTITQPINLKQKWFAKAHEAARKDVEQAFGVLQAQFAIVK